MNSLKLIVLHDDETQETAEVCVDAQLLGESVRFLLDTGCAKTTLSFSDLTSPLVSHGQKLSSGTLGRAEDDLVDIPDFKAGPIQGKNLQLSRSQAGRPTKNLLGMDLMKDHCLEFSFSRSEVCKIDGSDKIAKMAINDLSMERGLIPYLHFELDGSIVNTVWDTGAGITVVDSGFIARNPAAFEEAGFEVGTDSTGTQQKTPMFLMKAIRIGDTDFHSHRVAAVDFSHVNTSAQLEIKIDIILGYNALKQVDWIFDFPNRKWGVIKRNVD